MKEKENINITGEKQILNTQYHVGCVVDLIQHYDEGDTPRKA